jgi:hypothetical protein
LIHGTRQSNSDIFDDKTLEEFKTIGGNTHVNKSFSWGDRSGLFNTRKTDRYLSALRLVRHVMKVRKGLIKEGVIEKSEPITLAGYSHGGNIAIQAASKFFYWFNGKKVNIITIGTPAYNDGSSEDPANNKGIDKHIHIYSEADGVDAIAGGDETYNNGKTVNLKIGDEYIPDEGPIDTHSNIGNKSKNSGIGRFLKNTFNKKEK